MLYLGVCYNLCEQKWAILLGGVVNLVTSSLLLDSKLELYTLISVTSVQHAEVNLFGYIIWVIPCV